MPNKGGELSSDQKELIVLLSEDGWSEGLKIAELLKLNRFTVLKSLKSLKQVDQRKKIEEVGDKESQMTGQKVGSNVW